MSTSSRLSAWPRSGVAALGALALAWGALLAIAPPPSAAAATGTGTGADVPVDASGQTLGGITGVSQKDAAVTLTAARGAVRISFLDETSVRIEADPSGTFSDPANTPQKDPSDPTKSTPPAPRTSSSARTRSRLRRSPSNKDPSSASLRPR